MSDPAKRLVETDTERPFTFMTAVDGDPAGGPSGTNRPEWTKMSAGYARVSGTGTEGGTPLNAVGGGN
ncbi:hypothetical protein [Haloarcula marismortui]|uniref:hypothetical protein n=2 Tax=Haloarcula marismortui TaxID=2238 RepID=UPI001493FA62|nr:hypothetical protein [Haloarcula marismortui]